MVFVINVPLVPLVPPNTESKDRFVITIQYEITLNVGVMWVRMVFSRANSRKTLVGATGFEPVTSSL